MFHQIAKKNLFFTLEKPCNLKDIILSLNLTYKQGEKSKIFAIENDKEVFKRVPYDESSITNQAFFEDYYAKISKQKNYSFIEHLVALNKALLLKIFDDIEGKFYFSKLELKCGFIEDFSLIELHYQTHFNHQLMKSAIYVDKQEVGWIYFSLKR